MRKNILAYVAVFAVAVILTAAVAAVLVNINSRKQEASEFPLRVV